MGIGVSLILIAVGAVLAFAVHVTTSGFNINTVGTILLVVGAIGALISLISGRAGAASEAATAKPPSSNARTKEHLAARVHCDARGQVITLLAQTRGERHFLFFFAFFFFERPRTRLALATIFS